MPIQYFSDNFASWLKAQVPHHLKRYHQADFAEYILEEASKIGGIKTAELSCELPKLDPGTGAPGNDAENVRIVYSQLKTLTCAQASDERLWSYMTHIHNWEYMQNRWGVSSTSAKDKNAFVIQRYFLKTNNSRWLIRNGLSRLWWFGYLTYSDEHQWVLTDTLLELQDVQQALLERSYGKNNKVLHAALRVISETRNELEGSLQKEFGGIKKGYQQLGIYVGLLGGSSLLDAMPIERIEDAIKKKFL